VFETICNFREQIKNNVYKACILMVFKTVWSFKEIDESNMYLMYLMYLKNAI